MRHAIESCFWSVSSKLWVVQWIKTTFRQLLRHSTGKTKLQSFWRKKNNLFGMVKVTICVPFVWLFQFSLEGGYITLTAFMQASSIIGSAFFVLLLFCCLFYYCSIFVCAHILRDKSINTTLMSRGATFSFLLIISHVEQFSSQMIIVGIIVGLFMKI